MKKYWTFLLFFMLGTLCSAEMNAQKKRSNYIPDNERFSAAVLLGYNSAQIDGDYFTGFDKFGITGGIRGIARLTPQLDFNVEMLFSKKGSKIEQGRVLTSGNREKNRILDLTYMDAPFFFKYLLKNQASEWHIEAGGIFSRLIKSEITENIRDESREFAYETIIEEFRKDDISALVGLGYTWEKGLSLNFRYVVGVNKLYNNEDFVPPTLGTPIRDEVEFLRNYYYSLSFSYTIFQRESKDKKKRRK